MKIHFVISTPQSAAIAVGLSKAATRAAVDWTVFFTNDGVCTLDDQQMVDSLANASSSYACQESWKRNMNSTQCPTILGSQTNNSTLVGAADRTISL